MSLLLTNSVSTSVWKQFESVVFMGDEFDVNCAMEEQFSVAVHGGDQRRHILQVALGGDRLRLEIVGVGACHAVFIGGVMDDTLFLCGGDLPGINAERDTVLFSGGDEGWPARQWSSDTPEAPIRTDRCCRR